MKLSVHRCGRLSIIAFVLCIGIQFYGIWEVRNLSKTSHDSSVNSYRFSDGSNPRSTVSCQLFDLRVHIAVVASGSSDELRSAVQMMSTLIIHRTCHVTLHIFTQQRGIHVFTTLFNTLDLHAINLEFYEVNQHDISDELKTTAFVNRIYLHIPHDVIQVIYLSRHLRLVADVAEIWQEFHRFNHDQVLGLIPSPVQESQKWYIDIILVDLLKARNDSHILETVADSAQLWPSLQSTFNTYNASIYPISCAWSVRPEERFPFDNCSIPKSFYWNVDPLGIPEVSEISQTVALLMNHVKDMESMSLDTYRTTSNTCLENHNRSRNGPNTTNIFMSLPYNSFPKIIEGKCHKYIAASKELQRTHLYYMTFSGGKPKNSGLPDVTLVTIFTIDRYENFLLFIRWWQGPISAVIYCNENEVKPITRLMQGSAVISQKDLSVHLVYKRLKYFPINYLRNVGIQQSITTHTLFVDVDLVPNAHLYKSIIRYLNDKRIDYKQALVVPSFEALVPLNGNVPQSKEELLPLLATKTVTGFKMWRKWNYGHSPTNYEKWITTDELYNVIYLDAFEPYIVIPTSDMPLYEETLMERMGDKIAYGLHLYAKGYIFTVIPDGFVLHLMHPPSQGAQMWSKDSNYQWCGSHLMNAFKSKITLLYPDQSYVGKV